jgi:hypothetical protein
MAVIYFTTPLSNITIFFALVTGIFIGVFGFELVETRNDFVDADYLMNENVLPSIVNNYIGYWTFKGDESKEIRASLNQFAGKPGKKPLIKSDEIK